ncbi:MAG: helix-turn-helix transcriptional regulator [Bacteroidales bacterium]|nr:helix-turn-helix transcriptional regulator [Bacteroidales bacterium]
MEIRNAINFIKFKEKCTQKDIAERLGVKNTYISDVLNGRHKVSKSLLDKLLYHYPYLSEQNTDIFNPKEETLKTSDIDVNKFFTIIDKLQKHIEEQDELISTLQHSIRQKDEIIYEYAKKGTTTIVQEDGNVGCVGA